MLEWKLLHGPNEKAIRDTAMRTGMPLPDFIRNKPKLLPGLEIFWIAFNELKTDRRYDAMSGIPLDIPWSSIRKYAESFGWTNPVFFSRFVHYIRRMDGALIDFHVDKKKTDSNRNKTGKRK